MKAVFLDRATFSNDIQLKQPQLITHYQIFAQTPNDEATIIERCQNADIIITNKVKLTQSILLKLPKLKLIQLTATGMDNVDHTACKKLNIKLFNVAGYAVKSVPEHTFMLMLNVMRAGKHYHQSVVDNTWQNTGNFCLLDQPLLDLEGKTLGIIGVGTIGKRVAQIATTFGMTVLFAEHQNKPPRNEQYTGFEEVLSKSDIISLHCPLTKETQHLINNNTINKMDKTPLIINVARGGVVDSQAMATAVKKGQVFGYATDVFEIEPISDNDPLLTIADHPRVLFTPHNAWGSLAAQQKLWEIMCQQVNEFVRLNCDLETEDS